MKFSRAGMFIVMEPGNDYRYMGTDVLRSTISTTVNPNFSSTGQRCGHTIGRGLEKAE
jgi:hypothetical protein